MAEVHADKATVLLAQHQKLGGKIVPFGGWQMPVSYAGVLEEHSTVREKVGLFDVSHMGEVFVSGSNALSFLQFLTINDVSKLEVGGGQYSAMCNHEGGMVDDLILYRIGANDYLLCVNASNTDKDFQWISAAAKDWREVKIENRSGEWSQLALQGPNSLQALEQILDPADRKAVKELAYTRIHQTKLFDQKCFIARTGYTGEKGFEIYVPNGIAEKLWLRLLATEKETGIKPIGLGARDTLRLEACYLLYGNDMNDEVSPLEAGIGWATKLDAKDFIGKSHLVKQKKEGVKRKIFAFKFEDKAIPRHGMKVYKNGQEIGEVTSGSVLPTVGGAGGMALLLSSKVAEGDDVEVDVRGKRKLARIVKRPLYSARIKD
jgi:aminomethyltransferase